MGETRYALEIIFPNIDGSWYRYCGEVKKVHELIDEAKSLLPPQHEDENVVLYELWDTEDDQWVRWKDSEGRSFPELHTERLRTKEMEIALACKVDRPSNWACHNCANRLICKKWTENEPTD